MPVTHSLTPSSVNFGTLKYNSTDRKMTILLDGKEKDVQFDSYPTYQPDSLLANVSLPSIYSAVKLLAQGETLRTANQALSKINPNLTFNKALDGLVSTWVQARAMDNSHRVLDTTQIEQIEVSKDKETVSFVLSA